MSNFNYKIGVFMWYDKGIQEYADINYKINKIYCEKYGYTLIKSDVRQYPSKKAHWERIPLILEYFNDFDYLIWIDADAHFYTDSPPISNIIDTHLDKLFIFSGDTDNFHNETENKWVINSGVFIIKSDNISREILEYWLTNNIFTKSKELEKSVFGRNKWNDQAILRLMYSKNTLNICDYSIILDYGIIQHFNKSDKLKKQIYGLTNKPFIFHSTNGTNMLFENRVKFAKEYLNKFNLNKYSNVLNPNIQLDTEVIKDILLNVDGKNKKMLVFGLGYDSELWYNLTNKNTLFIENNYEYIKLNKNINSNNIIYYDYKNITVEKSLKNINKQFIDSFSIPQKILDNAPYDIILIDGPAGFNSECPGRLLPCYWSKNYLSKENTLIYVDDANRPLEHKCINKMFSNKMKTYFKQRNGTMKIIM